MERAGALDSTRRLRLRPPTRRHKTGAPAWGLTRLSQELCAPWLPPSSCPPGKLSTRTRLA